MASAIDHLVQMGASPHLAKTLRTRSFTGVQLQLKVDEQQHEVNELRQENSHLKATVQELVSANRNLDTQMQELHHKLDNIPTASTEPKVDVLAGYITQLHTCLTQVIAAQSNHNTNIQAIMGSLAEFQAIIQAIKNTVVNLQGNPDTDIEAIRKDTATPDAGQVSIDATLVRLQEFKDAITKLGNTDH